MTNAKNSNRKIGYVRVSDNEQNEALQVDALKHAGCSAIYGDHGVSGSQVSRKGLKAVLSDLEAGDTLVVWKLDRLGRSTLHLLKLVDDLRKRDIFFQAITQGIDTSTPVGRMVYGHLAVNAEFELEQIRERTKAGMAAAKARGVHIGRPKKLTKAQIRKARARLNVDLDDLKSLSKHFGVSPKTLKRAIDSIAPL